MSDVKLAPGAVLLVASRGTEPRHGLWRWTKTSDGWSGTQLGVAAQLSSLARHPKLPVVYGTSGVGQDGAIHAWRIAGDSAVVIGETSSEGAEPCHLAVDPTGRLLVITNYTSGTLAVQNLAADGSFDGPIELLKLSGGGPETDRQDDAHPHQAVFHGGELYIVDLGDDSLREFAVDPSARGLAALTAGRVTKVPGNAGPRHMVMLPDGRIAISGELGSNLIVGRPGDAPESWANVPSTLKSGPAKTRHLRNYPGDIQRSKDGRHVYFANRGYDTISTFDVVGATPELVDERDSTVDWPQHMLVLDDHLLIAGWDTSQVVAMPLDDGVPGPTEAAFACEGAGWLLLFVE